LIQPTASASVEPFEAKEEAGVPPGPTDAAPGPTDAATETGP
jgi:hypothetical protein